MLKEKGLQQNLPNDHPLLVLYRDLLLITHPANPECVKNYMSIVSRMFRYVHDRIVGSEWTFPAHWSQLLLHPELVVEYLRR